MRRGATRRDLPAICLFYGIMAIICAAVFSHPIDHLRAKSGSSQIVAGTVQDVFHERGKEGDYFNLIVQAADGPHHLRDEDLLTDTIPEMHQFVIGDLVRAEVKHDSQRNEDWCWELERNGHIILTREQTEQYLERMNVRDKKAVRIFDGIALTLSVILLTSAFLLRRHFGAWVDQRPKEPIMQS